MFRPRASVFLQRGAPGKSFSRSGACYNGRVTVFQTQRTGSFGARKCAKGPIGRLLASGPARLARLSYHTCTTSMARDPSVSAQAVQENKDKTVGLTIMDTTPATLENKVFKALLPVVLVLYSPSQSDSTVRVFEEVLSKANIPLILARGNIDRYPDFTQMFQLKSTPTTLLLLDGKALGQPIPGEITLDMAQSIVDSLTEFSTRIDSAKKQNANAKELIEAAEEEMKAGDTSRAAELLNQVLSDPLPPPPSVPKGAKPPPPTMAEVNHVSALSGLARCALQEGNREVAQGILSNINDRFPQLTDLPEVVRAKAAVDLSSSAVTGDKETLEKKIKEDPEDHQSRYELAQTLLNEGSQDEAENQLFTLLKKDRHWNNQAAKELILKLVESMGETDEKAKKLRRRLENVWYS